MPPAPGVIVDQYSTTSTSRLGHTTDRNFGSGITVNISAISAVIHTSSTDSRRVPSISATPGLAMPLAGWLAQAGWPKRDLQGPQASQQQLRLLPVPMVVSAPAVQG